MAGGSGSGFLMKISIHIGHLLKNSQLASEQLIPDSGKAHPRQKLQSFYNPEVLAHLSFLQTQLTRSDSLMRLTGVVVGDEGERGFSSTSWREE